MSKTCSCVHYLIAATKWIPVLVTTATFAWGWYIYVFQLILFSLQLIAQQVAYSVIFHILYVFSLWSYLKTIFTHSGQIPQKFFLPQEVTEDLKRTSVEHEKDEILVYCVKRNNLPVSCRTYSGGIRFCEKCNLIKPDRCHHCSICGVCVLKMDHHCPWINNCVSFTNYKFFVLFLGYTFALCIFVSSTTFPYTVSFWKFAGDSNGTNTTGISNQYYVSFSVRFQILFLFFVTSMLSLGIVFLFGYHIYLLLRNQSTLESFRAPIMTYGPDKSAFNLGITKNLLQLFGRNKLLWLVPIFTTEGNGLSYDQRSLMEPGDEEMRQEKL